MTQVPTITLNDGTTIPQLGFGVWQVSADDIVPSVTKALEVGYRHIDTAAIYGNEEGVGKAIAESGIGRDELYITTKLWNDRHTDARAAIEESLTKLGLDHVDLYLIHWAAPDKGQYSTAWQGLESIKAQGLSTSVGVSNFHADHLKRIIDEGSLVPSVNQIELHPTFTQTELVAANDGYGIKVESWSPLGSGADLGNAVIAAIAKKYDKSVAQAILRWHLQKDYIVIPKSITPGRIEENFKVFDFELTAEDVAAIDALDAGNRVGPNPDTFGSQ